MLLRPTAHLLSSSAASRFLFSPNPTERGGAPPPRRRPLLSLRAPHLAGCCRVLRLLCRAAASPGDAGAAVDQKSSAVGEVVAAVGLGVDGGRGGAELSIGIGSPSLPVRLGAIRMSLGDQAFFVLAFIASAVRLPPPPPPHPFHVVDFYCIYESGDCSYSYSAMKRAAISLAKLADTAREELPSTMAAIRLSGMEISDLTLELSDLSQEIADGVNKSAQAVQAAEAGIRKIGNLARHQTMSMIQERASLPDISFQPVVAGAARKTSHVVGQVRKTFLNIFSRGEYISDGEK